MPHGLFSEGKDYDGIDLEGLESLKRSHMRSLDLLGAIFCPRRGIIPLLPGPLTRANFEFWHI